MLKKVTIEYREGDAVQPINALTQAIIKKNKRDLRQITKFEMLDGDSALFLASGDDPIIRLSFWFNPEDENQAVHAKEILETIEQHPLFEKITRIDLDVDEADL